MFEARPGAGGLVLRAARPRGGRSPLPMPGVVGTGFGDDPAELVRAEDVVDQDAEPALAETRELARRIAGRLSVPRPRPERTLRRGRGELASLPFRGAADDLDLDATIEVLAERPVPEEEDIVVRDRVRTTRTVVLAVDVSGSARGERIATAAATVGALAAELARDRLGVLAFWSDAAVLLRPGEPIRPDELLDQLVRMPARGLTNVAFPLELAAGQLAGAPTREARALLLSDCVHNAGPDPRPLAAALPRLDVLLDTTGEKDVDLGRDLAHAGRGTLHLVRSHRDVAPALSEVFRER